MRESKTISEINNYVGYTINPLQYPEQIYELYSVPSFDNEYPEIIKGSEIGSSKVTIEEGDVLICKINPRINRVWVVKHNTDYPLIASSEWIVVRNRTLNPEYLKWYFSSPTFRTRIFIKNTVCLAKAIMITLGNSKKCFTSEIHLLMIILKKSLIGLTLKKLLENIP